MTFQGDYDVFRLLSLILMSPGIDEQLKNGRIAAKIQHQASLSYDAQDHVSDHPKFGHCATSLCTDMYAYALSGFTPQGQRFVSTQIQRPPGVDVGVNNPGSEIYIKGDAGTNGSIRIRFSTGDVGPHLGIRANGVWNDASFRVSSSSLQLGRDMIVSAVAGFVETQNPSAVIGHIRAFLPHIKFDGSRTLEVHAPILDVPTLHTVYSGAVGEIIGTTIGIQLGVSPGRAVDQSIHQVGTVGATEPVTVRFYVGADNTGILFSEKVLPASDLVANSTLTIEYGEDLGFEIDVAKFQEFTSDADFSLKIDAGGNPLTAHTGHEMREIGVITDNLMLDKDFDVMWDENLEPMYAKQFP